VKRYIDEREARDVVMRLLAIGGVSGHELDVARHIRAELVRAGVPAGSVRTDRAHERFPFPAECGNVIAAVSGRGARAKDRPRLFSAHMDTVELAAGARAARRGAFVVPGPGTALGADDRSGVGVLLTLVRTLARLEPEHPPLVLLFTACEEAGLFGARYVDPGAVRGCEFGFNFDGSQPAEFSIAAPSQDKLAIEIDGISSHAGVSPEKGVSAAVAFARATARLASGGWLGAVRKGRERGTSNIGIVSGGVATNIVMPHMKVDAEARSYSDRFLARIVGAFQKEFATAAARERNASGAHARVLTEVTRLYTTFDLGESSPVVREAARAARAVGLKPVYKRQFGGLDANWLNAHGLATVTLGTGGSNAHSTSEKLDLRQYGQACELALRLAAPSLE